MSVTATLPGPITRLNASFEVPTSKSLTNRALIAAAAAGSGTVTTPLDCEDTRLLADALAAAGWQVSWTSDIRIGGRIPPATVPYLDLGNSGTGARLIISLLACQPGEAVVDGTPRLRERPVLPLLEALRDLGAGIEASTGGTLPVKITGRTLDGGACELRPETSSQFVTSLLMAAPLMRRGLQLSLRGAVPSWPYLDLTEQVMRAFGGDLDREAEGRRWRVAARSYSVTDFAVEGDWSAAAFPMAAAAVAGGRVAVGPLRESSRQGDRAVCDILARSGITITQRGEMMIARGQLTQPVTGDLHDTPDLFPALAVVAAAAPAGSRLGGLEHLRHKESDRLAVMVDNLRRLGVRLDVDGNTFTVLEPMARRRPGSDPLPVTAAGDHRIAMAMAVAALLVGPLKLDDPACVVKSFPTFWEQWALLIGSSEAVTGGS